MLTYKDAMRQAVRATVQAEESLANLNAWAVANRANVNPYPTYSVVHDVNKVLYDLIGVIWNEQDDLMWWSDRLMALVESIEDLAPPCYRFPDHMRLIDLLNDLAMMVNDLEGMNR